MDFSTPATAPNPIDRGRIVTKPFDRIEGPLKVSGRAHYAYEFHEEFPNAVYGFVLGASIPRGKIVSIDVKQAEAAPGVLLVMTHLNAPKQDAEGKHNAPQLAGPEIEQAEQAVAFVVAESFEQARAAAKLIDIRYERGAGEFDLAKVKDSGDPVEEAPDSKVGDFDSAFASAPVKVDVTYTTPDQSHAMMEPHASVARWDGDRLVVYTSNQMIHWAHAGIAGTLGLPKEKVRVVSHYIGGGFGSKLFIYADPILAALAARELRRPVKVTLTRPQIFNHTNHRPATIQHLRLGADKDGKLVAVGHDAYCGNQEGGEAENAADQTKLLYGGENRLIRTRMAELHLPKGGAMRAPGEAVGLLALECAIDELAEKAGVDPVELRIRNDIQYDPEKGPDRPFSSRKLVECLRDGARRFGWEKRSAKPASTRDGQWLIGMGVAAGIRNNLVMPSGARATLDGKGELTIETQMTDIGTGSYTILGQVAAEMLGLPLDKVHVKLGDSDFPESAGSGGSWGANSASAGVYAACMALRNEIARKAGVNSDDAEFADGAVKAGQRSVPLGEIARSGSLSATDKASFGKLTKQFAQASFAAHFCELGVDAASGEVRIRRMLSVCAAGRILNPKTARSQCLGGMTMGIGAALMEEQVVDQRFGKFINHDLAEYQVPVHADIPALDVVFLDELDDKSSWLKAKGVGELGICGVGAAVANAVYNATGVRVRDYPLTLDKILPAMPGTI
ncbi:molybdopterin cofactor-binding domain-containing protein [Bosea sp. (in: a-proteobacteria)]|uniref:molybdopterin cofactor-binding domain-containing protein n=1 Tax=Bosea sp. (in: a-proteobacteria) TaxID=1871050 RepID=UPI003B3B419B